MLNHIRPGRVPIRTIGVRCGLGVDIRIDNLEISGLTGRDGFVWTGEIGKEPTVQVERDEGRQDGGGEFESPISNLRGV